jgi:glycosyltransferase involved in cell wall biosynthesis
VYVSASAAEGLSNALLEAMASGLPCVVTGAGGVGDVIAPERNGLVVPADDLSGLIAAVNRVLSDPTLAAELGRHARETVVERYSLTSVAAALSSEYRRLARRTRSVR